MRDKNIMSDIIYLLEPEETWNNSREIHEKRYGLETLKFVIWYLAALVSSIFLCCLIG